MYEGRTAEEAALLRAHCQRFSRMGWALFAQMLSMVAVQALALLIVSFVSPDLAASGMFLWVLSAVSAYGVGVPVFCLVIQGIPLPPAPQGAPLRPVRFFQVYLISMAALYLASYATYGLMALIGLLRGAPVENPVEVIENYPPALALLLGCVIAPVLEELVFRWLLLRRLRPYGDRFAIFASALAFGLFHGNLSQMFYAVATGVVFAYVVIRTGRLWQTMLLHAMVNAVAVVLIPLLERLGDVGAMVLGGLVLLSIVAGVTFFIALRRELYFMPGEYAFRERQKWRLFFENPGVICFCILFALMAASFFLIE